MADGNTGTVEFRGDRPMVCGEAASYTVTDGQGNEQQMVDVLEPGFQVSGIPEDELIRWIANPKFVAVDDAAEKANEEFQHDLATRINGTAVEKHEAEQEAEANEQPGGDPTVEQAAPPARRGRRPNGSDDAAAGQGAPAGEEGEVNNG